MEHYDGGQEYAEPEKNVLGIVGFALSFCTGPIGLIISLIALTKRPKGFAIAGVIISLISTAVIGFVVLGGAWIFNKVGGPMMAMVDLAKDLPQIQKGVSDYQAANNGALPPDLASLGLDPAVTQDAKGNPYGYTANADGSGWKIIWSGNDGALGTADDWTLDGDVSQQGLSDAFEDYMEEHGEDLMRNGSNP
ncbi:MAG: DUF4190 domain-containing protein [Phycisphaerales bacterium]|nr:DUF4190 domain-containing protein [Phycisphaerales bacterium]